MKIISFLLLCLIPLNLLAAEIIITIPDEKLERVKEAFWNSYPPEEGYTEAQWARRCLINFIIQTVHGYEKNKAIRDAVKNTVKDTGVAE